ncbi:uncharacterized protein LOC112575930 [Pomacea canaliculata]|uniref:uncharacterized protein LOC112575930 n=1 Tax=Pomacea canaliculata TaxID=400727 RepID=UPI000D73D598|nr:uncharacterized protein LOC112575930 [Pomacea canaliculata]
MRFSLIFFLFLLGLLLTEEKKERNGQKKNKGGKKKDSKGKPSCPNPMSVEDLEQGLNATCPGGVLASVNIIGVNETCRGITHDLFVQENQCYWKTSCLIKYNKARSFNFMLKLKELSTDELLKNGHCMTKSPGTFHVHFNCTKNKVEVFPILHESNTREINADRGILISHPDYPWNYDRADHNVTLRRPANGGKKFVYTFRDFRLWHKDVLTVSWTKDNKILFESYNETFMRAEPSPEETRKLDDAETVNFAFNAGVSYGAKGFVICFTWSDIKNACEPLFENGIPTCSQKKGGKKERTPKPKKGNKMEARSHRRTMKTTLKNKDKDKKYCNITYLLKRLISSPILQSFFSECVQYSLTTSIDVLTTCNDMCILCSGPKLSRLLKDTFKTVYLMAIFLLVSSYPACISA